jgi:hypothetical protein
MNIEEVNIFYRKVLQNWLKTETVKEELEKNKKIYLENGINALSEIDLKGKNHFLPNSIVMTLEDDPHDVCYFTPDGIKMYPIWMEKTQLDFYLIEESEESFYNLETFLSFYDGYESCLINFAILN